MLKIWDSIYGADAYAEFRNFPLRVGKAFGIFEHGGSSKKRN